MDKQTIQRCRWAEATIVVDDLTWTQAEEYPWSCRADGDPQIVQETERCATCGRWVPRQANAAGGKRCCDAPA